ncbi:MAG: hypothetical protein H5U21_05190 [Porphyrobacter sp.]|nr:hypothetical protein [Porphyrobacter sp.]
MAEPHDDRRARNRWLALSLSRIAGSVLAVLGVLVLAQPARAPAWLGGVALVAGLVAMAVVPRHLARKWRSPRP